MLRPARHFVTRRHRYVERTFYTLPSALCLKLKRDLAYSFSYVAAFCFVVPSLALAMPSGALQVPKLLSLCLIFQYSLDVNLLVSLNKPTIPLFRILAILSLHVEDGIQLGTFSKGELRKSRPSQASGWPLDRGTMSVKLRARCHLAGLTSH